MGYRSIHRGFTALVRAALLYGALCMVTSAAAQTPADDPSYTPTPLGVDVPHIALLLPVDSSTFRRHAEALRDGFLAASKIPDPPTLLIRVYPVGEDPKQAVASYRQAARSGARLVVGPLVRGAATAVAADDISVPTLLLNVPEGTLPNRPNLYIISLQIETEARQAAQLAWRDGRRSTYTIVGESQLLRRVHQAFIQEFVKLGGRHVGEFMHNTSPAELSRLRQAVESRAADMAYLALDARQARSLRATLAPLALYASSQVYGGDTGPSAVVDLAGIRIVDIPWLLQRDHPAVMIYPRQGYSGDADLERLYALGIDAWRIGQALLARHSDITLDGVTGKLSLGPDRQFTRELVSMRLGENRPDAPVGPIPAAIAPVPVKPAATTAPAPKPASPDKP
jgi:outer membrane PBP1 activator LpoA protein